MHGGGVTCDACFQNAQIHSCASQVQACLNEAECDHAATCMSSCTSGACLADCVTSLSPPARALLDAVAACECDACASACPAGCGPLPSASPGTSSGTAASADGQGAGMSAGCDFVGGAPRAGGLWLLFPLLALRRRRR